MKWLVIPLLGTVFVILLAGSVQSISAELPEPYIFNVELKDSKYQVYVQIVHRNEGGQLISVTESSLAGAYLPHKITDDIFDTLMGEKEIVTIDNIKYEKVRYTFSPTLEQRWMGMYPIPEQITININVKGDAATQVNKKIKDHNVWKIHYCADFANIGHHDGLQCIPIFQVLVPTMTLEPTDVITQHWTILRAMN